MWTVIVESEIVVYDTVVDMIRFQEMFECASTLFRVLFDVVDLDGGDVDAR